MQFGFMPGCGTTGATFLVKQLQEKYLDKKEKLHFAFVDLEKAFDRAPCNLVWRAMRKLVIEEWLVRVMQAMCINARSCVGVGGTLSGSGCGKDWCASSIVV